MDARLLRLKRALQQLGSILRQLPSGVNKRGEEERVASRSGEKGRGAVRVSRGNAAKCPAY